MSFLQWGAQNWTQYSKCGTLNRSCQYQVFLWISIKLQPLSKLYKTLDFRGAVCLQVPQSQYCVKNCLPSLVLQIFSWSLILSCYWYAQQSCSSFWTMFHCFILLSQSLFIFWDKLFQTFQSLFLWELVLLPLPLSRLEFQNTLLWTEVAHSWHCRKGNGTELCLISPELFFILFHVFPNISVIFLSYCRLNRAVFALFGVMTSSMFWDYQRANLESHNMYL